MSSRCLEISYTVSGTVLMSLADSLMMSQTEATCFRKCTWLLRCSHFERGMWQSYKTRIVADASLTLSSPFIVRGQPLANHTLTLGTHVTCPHRIGTPKRCINCAQDKLLNKSLYYDNYNLNPERSRLITQILSKLSQKLTTHWWQRLRVFNIWIFSGK